MSFNLPLGQVRGTNASYPSVFSNEMEEEGRGVCARTHVLVQAKDQHWVSFSGTFPHISARLADQQVPMPPTPRVLGLEALHGWIWTQILMFMWQSHLQGLIWINFCSRELLDLEIPPPPPVSSLPMFLVPWPPLSYLPGLSTFNLCHFLHEVYLDFPSLEKP